MTDRAFRFGVVAGQARTGAEWVATARRAEELGYDILLIPDTRFTLAPFPALAAEADIVTLGLPPSTPSAELFRTAATLRARAGDRPIELLSGIAAVAPAVDAVPSRVSRQVGGDARAMAAAGGAAFLIGDADTIAAELLRRREDGGFSYVAVNAMFMDAFEPVMSRLRPPVPVRP